MKAVVALVWLVVASASVSCCPDSCSCRLEQGLYSANCSDLPRTGGKVEALNVLRSLDDPLELLDGQFLLARHLKYLSMRNCSIYYIHKKAFYGAKSLVEIDLSFNYIEELEPTVFQQLTHLATLVLRGNPIQVAAEVPFLVSNSLQHLDIGHCQIRSIPRGVFYGLRRLKYLSLDGNFLKSLEYNSLPKGLKYINLSNNLIVNGPTEVLSTLTNLRRVGLGGNPINCSCSLLNLQDWLSGRGVVFENDVICQLPSEYYGVSWSKVDENRICLEEARREEIAQSIVYTPLFKNKLYKGNYFDNENSYLGENIQSDQPQADVHPDSQAEVLFQNEDTLAMGEMMNNEEKTNYVEKTQEPTEGLDKPVDKEETVPEENDEESATISKTYIQEEEFGTGEPPKEKHAEDVNTFNEERNVKNENVLSENDNDNEDFESTVEPSQELDSQDVLEAPSNSDSDEEIEHAGAVLDSTTNKPENNLDVGGASNRESLEDPSIKTQPNDEHTETNDDIETHKEPVESFTLNDNNPLEFKPFNELNENDPNSEADVIKQEGFYHVKSEKYSFNSSVSTEDPTILPNIEDTTDDEVDATDEPAIVETEEETRHSVEEVQNVTSTTEISLTPYTDISVSSTSGFETTSEATETVPPPVSSLVPDASQPDDVTTDSATELIDSTDMVEPIIEPEFKGNSSLAAPAMKGPEEKVKQVAGAEVVMFCIAVLIICLILYSIFKCRTSNKRTNTRTVKDMESNRGTEMQDMASLLPKPEEEQKKDLKYPTKAESSETVKLINEQNENESPNITPIANSDKLIDTKNSINNNSPLNQNGKTPLIKPEGATATINPLGPIQRTKAKVGIIPDSIPQTPILIQKSYTNGTKRV